MLKTMRWMIKTMRWMIQTFSATMAGTVGVAEVGEGLVPLAGLELAEVADANLSQTLTRQTHLPPPMEHWNLGWMKIGVEDQENRKE